MNRTPDQQPIMNRTPDQQPIMNRTPDQQPIMNRTSDQQPITSRTPESAFVTPSERYEIQIKILEIEKLPFALDDLRGTISCGGKNVHEEGSMNKTHSFIVYENSFSSGIIHIHIKHKNVKDIHMLPMTVLDLNKQFYKNQKTLDVQSITTGRISTCDDLETMIPLWEIHDYFHEDDSSEAISFWLKLIPRGSSGDAYEMFKSCIEDGMNSEVSRVHVQICLLKTVQDVRIKKENSRPSLPPNTTFSSPLPSQMNASMNQYTSNYLSTNHQSSPKQQNDHMQAMITPLSYIAHNDHRMIPHSDAIHMAPQMNHMTDPMHMAPHMTDANRIQTHMISQLQGHFPSTQYTSQQPPNTINNHISPQMYTHISPQALNLLPRVNAQSMHNSSNNTQLFSSNHIPPPPCAVTTQIRAPQQSVNRVSTAEARNRNSSCPARQVQANTANTPQPQIEEKAEVVEKTQETEAVNTGLSVRKTSANNENKSIKVRSRSKSRTSIGSDKSIDDVKNVSASVGSDRRKSVKGTVTVNSLALRVAALEELTAKQQKIIESLSAKLNISVH
eukprot:GHVL01028260.1.p1 GENE.GHVL01028260.1~~GHVL01028260.1.p1  ORF type:complete len:558 (+),score=106.18 GHVL01028260.1:1-1674(+)